MACSASNVRAAVIYRIIQSGATALDDGLLDKALVAISIALGLLERTAHESAMDIAVCQTLMGRCCLAIGKPQPALEWFNRALPIYIECDGPCSQAVSAAYSDHGTALLGLDRYEEAKQHFEEAVAIDEATLGELHPTTAKHRVNLGVSYYKMGELASAVRCYSRSMCVTRETLGEHHPEMAARWNNLGLAWKAMGEIDMALSAFHAALVIDRSTLADDHPALATTLYNLGITHAVGENRSAALDYLTSSYRIRTEQLGEAHPHTIDTALALNLARQARHR